MKHLIARVALALLAIVAGATQARAAYGQTYDLGQIEINREYDLKPYEYGDIVGTLVPTETGALVQRGLGTTGYLYADAAHSSALPVTSIDYGTQTVTYQVSAGTTYYLYCAFVMAEKMTFVMESDVALEVQSMPQPGMPVGAAVNSTGEIVLTFSVPVTYTASSLMAGGTSRALGGSVEATIMKTVYVRDAINNFYASGLVPREGGVPLLLTLEGVQTQGGRMYGGDGVLRLMYMAAPKALELVSTNIESGAELLSYYSAGDPRALLVMTFDGQVSAKPEDAPELSLQMGNIESDNCYSELIMGSVDGNTVTFDLSGVNRRPAIAAIGGQDGDPVAVKIAGVRDHTGQWAMGEGEGNSGSYSYVLSYKAIPEQKIAYQFIPANGASLQGVDVINLWYDHAGVIESFEGLRFAYGDGTSEMIAAAELVNVSTEADECEYNIPVPERAKTEGVDVEMVGIVSSDGYEKSIRASYNKFVVTYCYPFSEGATMAEIPADPYLTDPMATDQALKLIHVRTNYTDSYADMYIHFYLDDVTTGTSIKSTYMTRLDNGEYVAAAELAPIVLIGGHVYRARFEAYPTEADYYRGQAMCLGVYDITFYGAGAGYVYSSISFVDITPACDGTMIDPSTREFTLTYDGVVLIDPEDGICGTAIGMGMGMMRFAKVEAVDPDPENGGYHSIWRVTVENAAMTEGSIVINVRATDQQGLVVRGNMNPDSDYDYMSFEYYFENTEAYRELTVSPESGSTLKQIDRLELRAEVMPTGINYNKFDDITITDAAGAVVRVLSVMDGQIKVDGQVAIDDDGEEYFVENTVYVLLQLNEPITEAGQYTLHVPMGFATSGSQFDMTYTKEFEASYTVDPNAGVVGAMTDGVDVYVVYNAQGIKVLSTTDRAALDKLTPGFYIINGEKFIKR